MTDYVLNGIDYTEHLNSADDYLKFLELKELLAFVSGKKVKECFDEFVKCTKLDRELRGLPPVKVIMLPVNPNLN